MNKTEKLIKEIENVIVPKLFNIQHGTISKIEKDIVKECTGFLSLIKYSTMDISSIRNLWDRSNLKYM